MFKHSHHHSHHARRHMRGEGRPEGERGFGRHRRGGRGRMLEQGDLRLLLLHLIAEKPRHGYDLIKSIEERTGGAYAPSPGVIYPTLTLLEDQGLVRAEPADGKKQFSITAEGAAQLATSAALLETILARLGGEGEGAHGSVAPLMRAMANLKMALRLRLVRGPLPEERARAIAAAIDAAALEAEKT